jgi:starch-binding outer membrane protein, SusD/RagB family
MKRSHLIYTTIILLGTGVFVSCKKSFLETKPKGEFLESNYYSDPSQAFAGLAAAYDPLVTETGGSDQTYTNPLGPLNAASDDCYAGGGNSGDTNDWQVWNNYTVSPATGPQAGFWTINFLGVSRANTILSKLGGTGLDPDLLKRYTGEALFLRAHYYFDLLRLFGHVPLITKAVDPSQIYTITQAAPADVYAQIETDLKTAIADLPATLQTSENGRASQGAAIALYGKVLLYEKKYTDAATQLAIVNGPTPGGVTPTYNYALQANYGAIFDPQNKFNSEAIFEIPHTSTQSYSWNNWDSFKSNVYVEMVGPRDFSDATYAGGWGFNPITTKLHDAFNISAVGTDTLKDPRYGYTVLNIDSLAKVEGKTYVNSEHGYQQTGYFEMKYQPLVKYLSSTGTNILNFPNDYIEIRLADTYLMEAEALVVGSGNVGRAQSLLDAVRHRVGLAPVPVSLAAIKNERRLELATEGHRWFDLVRWGDAATVLQFKGFTANKNELLPIPLNDLSNTKLVQNPGYAK